MLLGVIADDFTGATDIAGFLVENGMKTIQLNGVPTQTLTMDADAVVISLKSRSCPAEEAVADSVAALRWLQAAGCQQFYFKYCSTFDSTAQGNIGPVTDALMAELGTSFTVICPALPVNGRTVCHGHLFVNGELLSESGMRHHPVTPMTDANLMRLMDAQSNGKSGLVNYAVLDQGSAAVEAAFRELQRQGIRYAVVDTLSDQHLQTIGAACKDLKLVTGGSGLAAGIARHWVSAADKATAQALSAGRPQAGKTVVLSGSCSVMTNQQVGHYLAIAPHFALDVNACLTDSHYSQTVCEWVLANLDSEYAPLVYATANPELLKAIQAEFGAQASSRAVEQFFSQLAHALREHGVRNFIVAGGETSGVVTQSLGVKGFHIGPQIAPGVPWVKAIDQDLSLALKSGNFGDKSFFQKAQGYFHD
ncbi:four-carbon acid sugar kinase family protein (plasmid) [Photobacterium sp. GJ3]|uniref:3-oxo-tetronate kinase n=1 Tax=Photobacterium sp. GJ3 TaxID=2829502 RepID=UPI001B8AC2F7|nr:3-oxo-tetronate kinase [Photobacterium sp. GJ3]QUJ69570.1 four-carbon acid sugar kinase family protein [Photobacterium sp. GJ3]